MLAQTTIQIRLRYNVVQEFAYDCQQLDELKKYFLHEKPYDLMNGKQYCLRKQFGYRSDHQDILAKIIAKNFLYCIKDFCYRGCHKKPNSHTNQVNSFCTSFQHKAQFH